MAATTHTAWLDAWEGAFTPSPRSYRSGVHSYGQAHTRTYSKSQRTSRPADHHTYRPSKTISQAPAIDNYDWEAAALHRPRRNECERVILHADRVVDARAASVQYYGREATARRPDPWPEAPRRQAAPRLRVVSRKAPRWRLGVLAGVFAALLIGLTVVAPIMTSSAVAGLESAIGQTEAQQQQLEADAAALSSQISSLSSPQRVAEEAAQLGLAPANDVSYLSTGEQLLASEGDTTVADR